MSGDLCDRFMNVLLCYFFNIFVGSCTTDPEALCFNAFSTTSSTSSSESCSGVEESELKLYVLLSLFGGLIMGGCAMVIFMYWFLSNRMSSGSQVKSDQIMSPFMDRKS